MHRRRSLIALVAMTIAIGSCGGDAPVAPTKQREDVPSACRVVPNYAGNVGSEQIFGGELLRWRAFPLRIALDTASLSRVKDRDAWKDGIARGVRAWSAASQGTVGTTVWVTDLATAEIVVRLLDYVADDCLLLNCWGNVAHDAVGRYLQHARINLYPEAGRWSADKIAQVTIHEMGHALGVFIHSREPGDVMYGLQLPPPAAGGYPWISASDLNTMAIAYCRE